MQTFHIIILVSAIVILILSLYLASRITKSTYASWPPNVPSCPDWWVADGYGDKQTCLNKNDLGSCPANAGEAHQKMDFNTSNFTGSNGLCNKYKWANNCNVSWDGITYGVKNPCL